MVNIKLKRIATVLLMLLAFMFTAFGVSGVMSASAITAEEDVIIIYSGNRNAVKVLDEVVENEPKYFKQLKDSEAYPAEDKIVVMNRIVAAAKAYTQLLSVKDDVYEVGEAAFAKDAGLQEDVDTLWQTVQQSYQDSYKLSDANYATYDSDGSVLQDITACTAKFEILLAQTKLAAEYTSLLAVNDQHALAAANQYYGIYDFDLSVSGYGLFELTRLYMQQKDAMETATDLDAALEQALTELRAVPRNVFEYVYNDYLEATAVERGSLSEEEADLENNRLVQEMGQCEKDVEEFYSTASSDVKSRYATQYSYLVNYFDTHQEYDGTAVSSNTSTLTYSVNGLSIMTVSAYIREGYVSNSSSNKPATVFSPKASISLSAGTLSGEARNATVLLQELNGELTTGYMVRFNVYGGTSYSSLFDTARADSATEGGVIYVISFDIGNYYKALVSQDNGFLGQIISETFLKGIWGTKDKGAAIADAYELLSGSDVDLCYMYSDGKLSPFENITYYESQDGGTLMLETLSFGNFAIAATSATPAYLSNPLFWILLIGAVIVLIVLIKLILTFYKYSVKFHSNGGSKVKTVKARKREYFVMPANPTKQGFVFAGWFEDKNLTKRFIATRILARKTLHAYAKWGLELTPDRVDRYYKHLRNILASHAALLPENAPEEGSITFATIEKGEKEIKLYLKLDAEALKAEGYQVIAAGEGYAETPALIVIATREDFVVAQKLVAKLVADCALQPTECEEIAADEVKYVLAVAAIVPVVEPVEAAPAVQAEEAHEEPAEEPAEEVVEEAVEEPAEEAVEEAAEEPVEEVQEEAPVEEEAEEEPASEEQLIEYFTTIRNAVCGYVLYEQNEKAEDGKMLVKLYKKDEAVYCYFALDAAAYGLETVGLGFSDTPALLKVATDADLEKALSLVEVVMTEHGLEKSDEPVEEKPYEGKSFGYRIHYVEE